MILKLKDLDSYLMSDSTSFSEKPRNILITGGSSGIGYQALLQLVRQGNRVTFTCRDETTSELISKNLQNHLNQIDISKMTYAPIVDLSDLLSIRKFVKEMLIKDEKIDTLVLNAGLQYTGEKIPRWSSQGIELTFAVNQLSHHFLAQSLLPLLDKSTYPRVVVTASEVHNPNAPGGRFGQPAGLGNLNGLKRGAGFKMIDGISEFNADKAYKDSKLCNVLFASEFYRKLCLRGTPMPVIAWAPGLVIPRTSQGFFRYSRKKNEIGQRIFSLFVRDIFKITESPQRAGKILSDLSTLDRYQVNTFIYYSNVVKGIGKRIFEEAVISKEAQDHDLGMRLWQYSCKLADLPLELCSPLA